MSHTPRLTGDQGIPTLHVVTDDEVLAGPTFLERAAAVLASEGGGALHLRGPGTGGRRLHELAARLIHHADASDWELVISDRIDLAMALGIGNVHLPGHALSVGAARALLGPRARVGRSVHGMAEAREAVEAGADYLLLGAVFPTATHPDQAALGPTVLGEVSRGIGVPVVAIGGVTPQRASRCLREGAHGVAVLSGVWHAKDPVEAVEGYQRCLLAGRLS